MAGLVNQLVKPLEDKPLNLCGICSVNALRLEKKDPQALKHAILERVLVSKNNTGD